MPYYLNISIVCALALSACETKTEPIKSNRDLDTNKKSLTVKYSKYFEIYQTTNGYELIINAPIKNKTQRLILSTSPSDSNQIKIPCKKITSLSSIYGAMICALHSSESIVAIDNIQYQTEPEIQQGYALGKIKAVQINQQLNLEALLVLKPDLIFDYSAFYQNANESHVLEKINIRKVFFHEYLENSPLARAEWIKVVGLFTNKYALADSLFQIIETEYLAAKKITEQLDTKKTIFCDTEFNGTWYVAGGKSYMAQLLKDAGANYIFANDTNHASIPSPFELVYAKAKMADYWINLGQVHSKSELLTQNKKYAWFKAFQSGNIYNNDNITNEHSGNAIWNRGVIEPHIVLKDLIKILYPDLMPAHRLKYYKQLK
jgi:iron complex transport system substrate-binding protein